MPPVGSPAKAHHHAVQLIIPFTPPSKSFCETTLPSFSNTVPSRRPKRADPVLPRGLVLTSNRCGRTCSDALHAN